MRKILNNIQNQQHVFPYSRGKCTGLVEKKQIGGVKIVNDVYFVQKLRQMFTDVVQLYGEKRSFG